MSERRALALWAELSESGFTVRIDQNEPLLRWTEWEDIVLRSKKVSALPRCRLPRAKAKFWERRFVCGRHYPKKPHTAFTVRLLQVIVIIDEAYVAVCTR